MTPCFVDPIMKPQLAKIRKAVLNRDRDYVMVIDGEEGSGKSVLAQQFAKELQPKFSTEDICFNADQFIDRLKKAPMNSCIVLDEAFSSANSRSALSDVNKSLISVATEMRQRNLFVIIVIPSFFDLDKYFALWRCRALFHVYFSKDGSRGHYRIYPKNTKKYLYLLGKKFYNYTKPSSPYPQCRFFNTYTIDEVEYRKKKAEAFQKRTVSNIAKRWKAQRDALVQQMYQNLNVRSIHFEKIFLKWGAKPVSQREIQRIVQFSDEGSTEEIIAKE